MKAVILAGGRGTRLSEETLRKPKPMVEIGTRPILWHIMKIYAAHGVTDFIICCGYNGFAIKEYFANFSLHNSDVTFSSRDNRVEIHEQRAEDWSVTLVDTGEDTMTGGRLRRVLPYLEQEQDFCLTYGDGVSDVDVAATIEFHRQHGKAATVLAVHPPARFGALTLDAGRVTKFVEKPVGDGGWINGGFFVLNPSVIDRIEGDETVWEEAPLSSLAQDGQLMAYEHEGFWQPMDTLRDRELLEDLWDRGCAPWKVWSNEA